MKRVVALVSLLALQASAFAEPGYYLVSTYENEGEKTVDFKFWNVNPENGAAVYAPEIGFGYNPTSRWYTELYAAYLHTEFTGTRYDALAWQNDYLLTQGQYPFDLALHLNIEKHHEADEGYSVEFGPVLQTDFGRTQVNANLFFERDYRTDTANRMQMKYQWQAKYRWRPRLQFGVQGFGEMGDWDHWSSQRRQSHRIGPALFGTLPLGGSQSLKYEAAYFTGKIYGEMARTFSMRVQYAF